jgi:hypothetical protein
LLRCNKHTFPLALFPASEAQQSKLRRNAKTAGEQDEVLAADRLYPHSTGELGSGVFYIAEGTFTSTKWSCRR